MVQNTDNTIYFNFTYFALNLLGKGLYSNHWTAISELIANSLDAQASSVNVYFNMVNKEHSTIEIFDDGTGMNYNDLSEKYVVLGKDKREDNSINDDIKKQVMGRKGIGKLAALYLSRKYYIVSKKLGDEVTSWCLDASSVNDDDIPHLDRCAEPEIECIDEWNKLSNGTLIKLTDVNLANFGERTLSAFEARLADYYLTDSLHGCIRLCVIDKSNQAIAFKKVQKSIAFKNFYAFYNNTSKDYSSELSDAVYITSKVPEITSKKRTVEILDPTQFIVNGSQKFRLKNGELSSKYFNYSMVGWIGIHSSINKDEAQKNDGNYLRNKVYRPNQLRLYVRKKLAVENFLDYVKNTQAFSNYIEGEISFDILDDNELGDIATSNRQGLVEDDERVLLLVNLVKPIINKLIRSRVRIGTAIGNEETKYHENQKAQLEREKHEAERQKQAEEQLRKEAELNKQHEEKLRKQAELAKQQETLMRKEEKRKRIEAEQQKALEKKRADELSENLGVEKKRSDFLFDSLDDNQIEFAKRLHMLKINSSAIEQIITKYLMKLNRNRFSTQDAWDFLKKISYQNKRNQAVLSYGAIAKFDTKAEFTEGNLFGFIEEYCSKILDRHHEISIIPKILNNSEYITRFAPQDIVIIIDNVLSNSIKHKAKSLTVTMSCSNKTACIDFIDDGIGVSPSVKDLDELFEFGKGYTLNGTGVGLYHIKEIVSKNMKGTVTITSQPKNGFSLHIRINKNEI